MVVFCKQSKKCIYLLKKVKSAETNYENLNSNANTGSESYTSAHFHNWFVLNPEVLVVTYLSGS